MRWIAIAAEPIDGWTWGLPTRLDRRMRVGASLRSNHDVNDDPRVGARWMVERTIAARDAGLDSLFVGDHHATGPFDYFQNTPIMGRLLAEWDARTAGILMLLPLWHPVLAAEQLGTLAAIADGPFVLQCALGGGEQQFAAMGTALKGRVARFEACLDAIRHLLAGEAVTIDDGPRAVGEARVAPVPPESFAVWIGASAPAAIDRAARLGDGWIASPELVADEVASQAEQYLERCAAHGREPGVVALRRDVYVGSDSADAERVAGPIVARGYRGFRPEACTYGDVDAVIESLQPYAEIGFTDIIVRELVDDPAAVVGSYERTGAVRDALLAL
jgi:alkanesulfonate monooxygenase SsuD/methylene tetrahydromethanopterin reductase-like flavin-dependent oxidoreductase (luciferase family)